LNADGKDWNYGRGIWSEILRRYGVINMGKALSEKYQRL